MKIISNISVFAITISLFAFSSCASDSTDTTNNTDEGKVVTLSGEMTDVGNSSTRASFSEVLNGTTTSFVSSWDDDDDIDVFSGGGADANKSTFKYASVNGKMATFTGTFKGTPTATTKLYAIVNNTRSTTNKKTQLTYLSGVYTSDLTKQSGTLQNALAHDFIVSSATYADHVRFTFSHELAIFRIDFVIPGISGSTNATSIRLLSDKSFPSTPTYTISTQALAAGSTYTNAIGGTATTIPLTDGKGSAYFALYPGMKITDMRLEVTESSTSRRFLSTIGTTQSGFASGQAYATSKPIKQTMGCFLNKTTSGYEVSAIPSANGTTAVGVIFHDVPSTKDKAAGFTHGYVLSGGNCSVNESRWSTTTNTLINPAHSVYAEWTTYLDGYTDCQAIKNLTGYSETSYPPVYHAINYSVAAPTGTSGWYLPSIGQLYVFLKNIGDINPDNNGTPVITNSNWTADVFGFKMGGDGSIEVTNINKYLNAMSGTPLQLTNTGTWFWTSTEYNASHPLDVQIWGGSYFTTQTKDHYSTYGDNKNRAVLAY